MKIHLAEIVDAHNRLVAQVDADQQTLAISIVIHDGTWEAILNSDELKPLFMDADQVIRIQSDSPATAAEGIDDLHVRLESLSASALRLRHLAEGFKGYELAECEFSLKHSSDFLAL